VCGVRQPQSDPRCDRLDAETSDHTSVQCRIEAVLSSRELPSEPLTIDEAKDDLGPCVSQTGKRVIDKGVLPMTLVDYLQLLDWTEREMRPDKAGYTEPDVPPAITHLGLQPTA
jgi:hypothetical protein